MLWLTTDKKNNAGFSLIELIIVVSILAIAAVPLMKSMGMASKVNVKAQSIQNATSLAERVMEEVKSTPIEDLLDTDKNTDWTITGDENVYTLTRDDMYAAQTNEKFNVTVTIDKKSYSSSEPDPEDPSPTPLPTKAAKVKTANIHKLPSIEDIDTMTQAVLTSSKEINRYDEAAQSFFNEKKADYKPEEDATKANITKKTITIIKECKIVSGYEIIRVNAKVRYEGDSTSIGFERDLYSGAFTSPGDPGDEEYSSPDSNIYIFYSRNNALPTSVHDEINIINSDKASEPKEPSDSRRIYLIMQNYPGDPVPDISIKWDADKDPYLLDVDDLEDGRYEYKEEIEDKDVVTGEIVTNIGGHIYKDEARIRVYKITVVLTKDGDDTEYSRLTSTVTASDEAP